MPTDDRLWPHVNKCTFPSGPKSPQQNPEDPIRPGEAMPRMPQRQRASCCRNARFSRRRSRRERRSPFAIAKGSINRRNILHLRIRAAQPARLLQLPDCAAVQSFGVGQVQMNRRAARNIPGYWLGAVTLFMGLGTAPDCSSLAVCLFGATLNRSGAEGWLVEEFDSTTATI